jgi:hypothetical protein
LTAPGSTFEYRQKAMYSPAKDGIEKSAQFVRFTEAKPPESFHGLVHSYWELKTEKTLPEDFHYHIIPDACVNILFNQRNLDIAAVTAAPASALVLNLGKDFHFVGIQLFPGTWRGHPNELCRKLVGGYFYMLCKLDFLYSYFLEVPHIKTNETW